MLETVANKPDRYATMIFPRAPVLFIGHGSPLNAIEDNSFTKTLVGLRRICPNPSAILCISAHWMTEGTWVTHMAKPKTIHDFYGFPDELFAIQYPAPGCPELAELISQKILENDAHLDDEMWGFDHGTWSVLRHIFPKAEIPLVQLSLHLEQPPQYHFDLGKKLSVLRDQGVLIIGSGNVVHNLKLLKWETEPKAYEWATQFDEWIKSNIRLRNYEPVINNFLDSESGRLSVPTLEHYLPLLYILGASEKNDKLRFEFEEIQNGSISMRTISFGGES